MTCVKIDSFCLSDEWFLRKSTYRSYFMREILQGCNMLLFDKKSSETLDIVITILG